MLAGSARFAGKRTSGGAISRRAFFYGKAALDEAAKVINGGFYALRTDRAGGGADRGVSEALPAGAGVYQRLCNSSGEITHDCPAVRSGAESKAGSRGGRDSAI